MSASEKGEGSPRLRDFRAAHGEFLKAFNEGDFERAFAPAGDDFELCFAPEFPQERLLGRTAIVQFFEEFRRDMSDWRLEPTEYIEVDPFTFIVGAEGSGFGRTSGIGGEHRVWDVVELDQQGRLRRDRQFFDRSEALAAAGSKPLSKGAVRTEEQR